MQAPNFLTTTLTTLIMVNNFDKSAPKPIQSNGKSFSKRRDRHVHRHVHSFANTHTHTHTTHIQSNTPSPLPRCHHFSHVLSLRCRVKQSKLESSVDLNERVLARWHGGTISSNCTRHYDIFRPYLTHHTTWASPPHSTRRTLSYTHSYHQQPHTTTIESFIMPTRGRRSLLRRLAFLCIGVGIACLSIASMVSLLHLGDHTGA